MNNSLIAGFLIGMLATLAAIDFTLMGTNWFTWVMIAFLIVVIWVVFTYPLDEKYQ